jgi:regulatory factor X
MIMRFGEHLAHSNSQTNSSTLDPALHETSGSTRDRPDMSFEHSYHGHDNINRSFQSDMPPKGGVAGEASHAYANALFDVVDNHISDQLADDNDAPSEPGARKRKGTTSSIANDKELRRLLDQYDGYTLQEMALEVQKSEGAGGKSEKAKQVLAMIW